VQVFPIKPTLKAAGTRRFKLRYDGPLSNFALAFNVNLRRYNKVCVLDAGALAGLGGPGTVGGAATAAATAAAGTATGRGFHSFTVRLNVSAFCGIGGAFGGCVGAV
jgi:hypothetical protein